ncbi:MAG: UvrD-helicase domain-containing protein, partial [Gammaproteobacteria bacterium]
ARMITPDILARREREVEEHRENRKELHPMLRPWVRVLDQIDTPGFTKIYKSYQRSLSEQNAVDFSDLMNHTTQLFRENPSIRD